MELPESEMITRAFMVHDVHFVRPFVLLGATFVVLWHYPTIKTVGGSLVLHLIVPSNFYDHGICVAAYEGRLFMSVSSMSNLK
jgi:hypothetical protein